MRNYSYTAWDTAGAPLSGVMAAASETEVAELLRTRGLVVGRVEINKDLDLAGAWRRFQEGRSLPLEDLALMSRQLATMIGAGVPILQALRIIASQTRGRRLGRALTEAADGVEAGDSLTEAFRSAGEAFPPLLLNMVAVGEAGGVLEEVLLRLAELYEREHTIGQKMRSAMIYPAVVLGVAVLVAGFLVTVVLPGFAELFAKQGALLPWPTRFLLGLAAVVRGYWYLLLAAAVAGAFGLQHLQRRPDWARRRDPWLLRLPVLGPLRLKRAMGLFARTLATLLRTGVPILPALSVVSRGLNNEALEGPLEA
ncbi:MAG: type II secretion system F family protein, partial [Firmicutes bacterium]|nr:type II secretion system F family protein [Bacillota bacterium]